MNYLSQITPPPNSGSLADWSAVFIAILALIFTLWQAREARRHNVLSYRPGLIFTKCIANFNAHPLSIHLEIFLDDEKLPPGIKGLQIAVTQCGFGNNQLEVYWPTTETMWAVGKSALILSLPLAIETPQLKARFLDLMDRVNIKVTYQSLYEEEFTADFHDEKKKI